MTSFDRDRDRDVQLQVTRCSGAEGKIHLKAAKDGPLKKEARPSFAGPESPRPCSHMTTLLLTPAISSSVCVSCCSPSTVCDQ